MLRQWVETWSKAGPELEAIRRQEIRQADNLKVLAVLEQAFNQALRSRLARPSSGLVEMQEWLSKIRS